MESLNGKEPLSENEEETLVGEEIGEVGEIAYWKAKAEEWRNVALESRLELEEFQNESRYKTHSTFPIRTICCRMRSEDAPAGSGVWALRVATWDVSFGL